jgi:hypothetical protein
VSLIEWDRPHFKADEPSRVDEAITAKADEAATIRQWDAAIDRRDRRQCRACGKHSDPDVIGLTTRGHRAHIVYASAGGSWEPSNRVTLCARCHNDEHKDRLRFTESGGPYVGIDANLGLEFWRKDEHGQWFLSQRETAPFVIEKD